MSNDIVVPMSTLVRLIASIELMYDDEGAAHDMDRDDLLAYEAQREAALEIADYLKKELGLK